MDNERITKEFEIYARTCSYTIGAHFKGRTNKDLEKILVSLSATRSELLEENLVGNTLLIEMIDSFIDGIRGKKLPGI